MRGLRRSAAVATLALCGAAGVALTTASAASADEASGGASSLSCSVTTAHGQRAMACKATPYYYWLHTMRVNNLSKGNAIVASTTQPCGAGGTGNAANGAFQLVFRAPTGNAYKVTVTDCIGDRDVYKVRQNGAVSLIGTNAYGHPVP